VPKGKRLKTPAFEQENQFLALNSQILQLNSPNARARPQINDHDCIHG